MHAFHHVNEEGVWKGFCEISPVYKEFLAQLFTFKCVQHTYLEKYFRELSESQPTIYQTWVLRESLSVGEVYELYNKIKSGPKSVITLLDEYSNQYLDVDKKYINNSIKIPRTVISQEVSSGMLIDFERAMIDCIKKMKNNQKIEETRVDIALNDNINNLW